MNRREFLQLGALVCASKLLAALPSQAQSPSPSASDWESVRRQFSLSKEYIHLGAMLVSSHPKPVQQAIERYQNNLNALPVTYLQGINRKNQQAARAAAGSYLGARADEIALTDSTTMGLGLVYGGLRLNSGDEILTSVHDYYVTHQSLRLAAARNKASIRMIRLYQQAASATRGEIIENLSKQIGPRTRVLALTWVHSGNGIKLPLREIADIVRHVNAKRPAGKRILFCVDGVHGLGVEDFSLESLGCDFFIAGCHKWLFGPRGTGIVWGKPDAWSATQATIPTFIDNASWGAWHQGNPPPLPTNATRMTPGGFKAFEHLWGIADAFEFHQQIGKARIASRTHQLAQQFKEGLAMMPHVTLHTPLAEEMSAGIVCFSVQGFTPQNVIRRLLENRVIATVTPYSVQYARVSPCIYNTPEELETVLRLLRKMG